MQALCVSNAFPFIPKVPNHTKKIYDKTNEVLSVCLSVCPFMKEW